MGDKTPRTLEEIERAIARNRIDLMADVDQLQRAIRARLDWRRPVRRHPWTLVATAFALGFLIGWR